MRFLLSISHVVFIVFAVLSSKKLGGCNPITNSDLNQRIREFSTKNDINSTAKTLQKEELGRHASFVPARNPVRFKDAVDSALSSSSHSRGLVHHEHPGYTFHEYEESPPFSYEYHGPGGHELVPHGPHYGYHQYHHKHYDHALAAKAFLWPIAGIALLGAAAALVSNPLLLQLGVVSGRRKRRDTEENFEPEQDTELSWLGDKEDEILEGPSKAKIKKRIETTHDDRFTKVDDHEDNSFNHRLPKKSVKREPMLKKLLFYPTVQSLVDFTKDTPRRYHRSKYVNENKLVPVPLISKEH